MNTPQSALRRFLGEKRAASTTQYMVLVSLLVIVFLGALAGLGQVSVGP